LRFDRLKLACDRLLAAAEGQFGPEIDLNRLDRVVGEYWTLAPGDAYVCGPQQVMAGDVGEDLAEVDDLLGRPDDEIFLWHDLEHLVGLLGLIAFLDLPPGSAHREQRNTGR
jgi:hypothetical protein